MGEIRSGRESHTADERVLGGIDFVGFLLGEVVREKARRAGARRKAPELPTLVVFSVQAVKEVVA